MTSDTSQVAGTRYVVESALGVGGMGAVYRVRDNIAGRTVALKRLDAKQARRKRFVAALFEREYHTLAQLSHPSVIEVYDYGVDDVGPYYTMELLEGQDLRQCGAMPYRELCGVLHDVTSCLSLLHARRLVHRDVTRRNIRVVRSGRAKLLDFGALASMSASEQIVGTPMYMPPEAVMLQSLDGRADLFALGVVLYHTLTGRYPYPARSISELRAVWRVAPEPPHKSAPDVPRALSDLAMSLIALDRDARPRDAAEVMERLAAIGELEREEPPEAPRAYLLTPTLVGRNRVLLRARERLVDALQGKGGGLVFAGPAGVGRTRMLDAAVLEAKVLGAAVLRAPRGQLEEFGAAQSLIEQAQALEPNAVAELFAREPELRRGLTPSAEDAGAFNLFGAEGDRLSFLAAACRIFAEVARRVPIAVAVDDIHQLDKASVALLATLLKASHAGRLLVLATVAERTQAEADLGLRLLLERCERITLAPLGAKATRSLMRSIFGTVPHVDTLGERLHRLSQGYPRDAIALAEHLIDRGVITYRAGSFVLPASLDALVLPSSLSEALVERVRSLSPLALALSQAHALSARRSISLQECQALAPEHDIADIHWALDELLAADVFATEGGDYYLRHDGYAAALCELLDRQARAERHRALARALELDGSDPLALAYHTLLAGDSDAALSRVLEFVDQNEGKGPEIFEATRLSAGELGFLFERAFSLLQARSDASVSVKGHLRYFVMAMGVFVDEHWFYAHASAVEAELKCAAGHDIWSALDASMEPMARLGAALERVQKEYERAPEEYCFPPFEAIKHLVQYAVSAIAVGGRALDNSLRRRLPGLLEPFAPLSPLIAAMKENCRSAAEQTYADYEHAASRLEPVVRTLSTSENAALPHAEEIRIACLYAIGAYRARLGILDVERWLEPVANHPRQASSVMRTRALLALQRGDWSRALVLREAAEQYDLESDSKQMFGLLWTVSEIEPYARGLDLSALKQLGALFEPLAERYPEWATHLTLVNAECDRLRGDLQAALAGFDACAERALPEAETMYPDSQWYTAETGALEILLELGRLEECLERARRALRYGGGKPQGARYDGILRALALCEARLGDIDSARERLSALVTYRHGLGTRGLYLGLLYEAQVEVALQAQDFATARDAFARAQAEYMSIPGSGYAGRVHRLRRLLRAAGVRSHDGDDITRSQSLPVMGGPDPEQMVSQALDGCRNAAARATHGLSLLCAKAGAVDGHLFFLQGEGVALTATLTSAPPPTGLTDFVRACVDRERELEQTEAATMTAALATMVATATADSPTVWTSAGHCVYHPVWIRANLAGESSLVGLAVLGYDGPAELPRSVVELAAAFGDYLLRTGDGTVTACDTAAVDKALGVTG